jgi:hypothetical protein
MPSDFALRLMTFDKIEVSGVMRTERPLREASVQLE